MPQASLFPTKMHALSLRVFLAIGAAASVRATPDYMCNNTGSPSRGRPHCHHDVTLSGDGERAPQVLCVHNAPLSPQTVLTGGLLRLFDVQRVRIRGESLGETVEFKSASEDTWLTGVTAAATAEEQVRAAFRLDGPAAARLQVLQSTLRGLWRREGDSVDVTFSPFYPSCVAVRASTKFGANVTVEWFREGRPSLSSALYGEKGSHEVASLQRWSGVALLFAGLLLFVYAGTLAKSIVFHYASGVSLAMILGVLLVVFLVWQRTGRRRPGVMLASVLSFAGLTVSTMWEWAASTALQLARAHWPYLVAYLATFGLVGYACTYWRLRGEAPPDHEVALLARAMRLVGLLLVWASSHSVRASAALLVGLVGVQCAPTSVLRGVGRQWCRLWGYVTERGPASAPNQVDGKQWRPPTASGRYLSEEEYEMNAKVATDASLKHLFASPEYQKWLLANHGRMVMADGDGAVRQPDFDGADDDDDD